ncbi:MAG: flagellar motor switch protein FliN [Rhodothermales bacterium]
MNSFNLKPLIAPAEEALQSFLATLLGEEASFQVSDPERMTFAEAGFSTMEYLVMFNSGTEDERFAIVLDPQWLPLVSKAMLGESMEVGEEGADDLMRELAGQGYGAIRNHFGMIGVRLPDASFDVLTHGNQVSADQLPSDLWKIAFSTQIGEQTLDGMIFLPDAPEEEQEESLESVIIGRQPAAGTPQPSVAVASASFPELGVETIGGDGENFGLLAEVELEVTVELGRRKLPLADILRLTTGSVIELENLVGEPLEIYANGRLIAEGEAVVIDEQFGIRITRLASEKQRTKAFL